MTKYSNKPTVVSGIEFASKAESRRYLQLRQFQQDGAISGLKVQPTYVLLPAFVDSSGVKQRAISYVGDFAYVQDGRETVEDVKGYRSQTYSLKKKLFLNFYRDIVFKEIQV